MVNDDFIPISSSSGIYILVFNNRYIYLGSSKNMHRRVTEHYRLLNKGNHYNKLLQEAYYIYKGFESYCIEKCEESLLFTREQYYLDNYCPALNISKSASMPLLTHEQIQKKQGGERNPKAVISLDQAINIVRLRNKGTTVSEISSTLNISEGVCYSICSRSAWREELLTSIPDEYNLMLLSKKSIASTNRTNNKPTNRLFNDNDLLDILKMIISRAYTIQDIASKYNTSKAVVSSIKNIQVYRKDIERLLTEEEFNSLISIPKGILKCK